MAKEIDIGKIHVFFYQGFLSQSLMIYGVAVEGKEGTIGKGPYSSLPLPPAHEHSDTFYSFAYEMYHVFLITPLVISCHLTTLGNYHLIDCSWNVNVCLFDDFILDFVKQFDTGKRLI